MNSYTGSDGFQNYNVRKIPFDNKEFLSLVAKELYIVFQDAAIKKNIKISLRKNRENQNGIYVVLKGSIRRKKDDQGNPTKETVESDEKIEEELIELQTTLISKIQQLEELYEIWNCNLNQEEYNYLVKHKLQKQNSDAVDADRLDLIIDFYRHDGLGVDGSLFQLDQLDVIKSYKLNNLNVNFGTIKDLTYYDLSSIDYFFINIDEDGVFLDQFGAKLINHPILRQNFKKNQKLIFQPIPHHKKHYFIETNETFDGHEFKIIYFVRRRHNYEQSCQIQTLFDYFLNFDLSDIQLQESQEELQKVCFNIPIPNVNSEEFVSQILNQISVQGVFQQFMDIAEINLIVEGQMVQEITSFLELIEENSKINCQSHQFEENKKWMMNELDGNKRSFDVPFQIAIEIEKMVSNQINRRITCYENDPLQYIQKNKEPRGVLIELDQNFIGYLEGNETDPKPENCFQLTQTLIYEQIYDHQVFQNKIKLIKIEKKNSLMNGSQEEEIKKQSELQFNKNIQKIQKGVPFIQVQGKRQQVAKMQKFIQMKINEDTSIKKLRIIKQSNNILNEHLQSEIEKLANQNNIKVNFLGNPVFKFELLGFRQSLIKNLSEFDNIIKLSSFGDVTKYPEYWHQEQAQNCKLYQLNQNSEEYQKVETYTLKTSNNMKITQIFRIQNKILWKNFNFEQNQMKLKGNDTEKLLFHGTRSTDPKYLYQAIQDGFDYRFSARGMMGIGAYFAVNSSYSQGYAHHSSQGNNFMLVRVLVGNYLKSGYDSSYVSAPYIPGSKQVRYDSVHSNDGVMFVVYTNFQAYPQYLIYF